jgi:hypothetical protein
MSTETLYVVTEELKVRLHPRRARSRAAGHIEWGSSVKVSLERTLESADRIWRRIVEGAFQDRFIAEVYNGERLLSNMPPLPRPISIDAAHGHGLKSLFPPSLVGLHANSGGWAPEHAETAVFRENGVKIAVINADQSGQAHATIHTLRGAGVERFIIRATASGVSLQTPQAFLEITTAKLAEYRQAIGAQDFYVQIHNEPNLKIEGLGSAWHNGHEFAEWFKAVASAYRQAFPGVRIGFSPMSPNEGHAEKMGEQEFTDGAGAAIAVSDWIAVHAYWEKDDGTDLEFPRPGWKGWFGSKPLLGTEIGPADPHPTTVEAVRHAYSRFRNVGIAGSFWLAHHLSPADPWINSSWTFQNLRPFAQELDRTA